MKRRLPGLLACCLLLLHSGPQAAADPAMHWHSASGQLADGRSYCALKFDEHGEATLALRYDAGSEQPTLSLSVATWPVQVDRPTLSFDRTGSFVPVGDTGPVGLIAPITMMDLSRFLDPGQTLTISTPQWPTQAVRIDMQPGDAAIENFKLCIQLHQPSAG